MEKRIDTWIGEAEERWLEPLQRHVTGLFARTFLPSHDQTHHQRVWNNCRILLREISRFNARPHRSLVEGVMVAAWFHDSGMASDPGRKHGALGREMCEEFFREGGYQIPERYSELLDAIENHDRKGDRACTGFTAEESPGILDILAVADDLDALGTIGIYRYAEIYLHRSVPPWSLGVSVLGNAQARFMSMAKCCSTCPALMERASGQYTVLTDFYNLYNQQLLTGTLPDEVMWGHLGIVNHIRRMCVEGGVRPEQMIHSPDLKNAGMMVKSYFKELKDELEQEDR